MLRVVCMALMNVIPVVTTIFGAAYAVQPAYGIGFHKDVYLWIPVLGNILAVLVIPLRRQPVGQDRPPAADHRRRARRRAAVVRLSLRHQHPQRAAGDRHVAADVGRRLPGLQRRVPELLPRAVPDAHPGLGDGHLAEHRDDHHRALLPALFAAVAPPGSTNIPLTIGALTFGDHVRRGDRGLECARDLPRPHERSRRPQCGSGPQGRIRPDSGADDRECPSGGLASVGPSLTAVASATAVGGSGHLGRQRRNVRSAGEVIAARSGIGQLSRPVGVDDHVVSCVDGVRHAANRVHPQRPQPEPAGQAGARRSTAARRWPTSRATAAPGLRLLASRSTFASPTTRAC